MATATPKTKTVTVTKPVQEEQPDGVTLTLTQAEAEALRYVTRRISGSHTGPRGLMDNIGGALDGAGIEPNVSEEATQGLRFPTSPPPVYALGGYVGAAFHRPNHFLRY